MAHSEVLAHGQEFIVVTSHHRIGLPAQNVKNRDLELSSPKTFQDRRVEQLWSRAIEAQRSPPKVSRPGIPDQMV
jgi:hypothetical protein